MLSLNYFCRFNLKIDYKEIWDIYIDQMQNEFYQLNERLIFIFSELPPVTDF